MGKKTLIALLMLISGAAQLWASLNVTLIESGINHLTWSYDEDDEFYTFTTTGNDPYVYAKGFSRALEDGEVILSFEYQLDQQIPNMQIYFRNTSAGTSAYSWGSAHSIKNLNVPAASEWTEFTLDISTYLTDFEIGAAGDQFRLDFGGEAGKTIKLRKLRIRKAENDPYVAEDNGIATVKKLIATGLPLLMIETVNGEFPTAEYVTPTVPGAVGSDIINNEYVNGRLRIYDGSTTAVYDSGDYVDGESGMRIRLRGNSSASAKQKPFKIKLENKADLMLRGNDTKYADKEWLLIRDEKMVDFAGYKLSEILGFDFVPGNRFVNVWFNDKYQGLYLLVEYVKRNANCRINISDTGYLFEDDPYWWTADDYVQSTKYPEFSYTFRDPKLANMTTGQRSYIETWLANYEQAIASGSAYEDYVDVTSLSRYALGHEILGTHDAAGANMYLTKYDNTSDSKIKVACMWDFDTSETHATDWSNTKTMRLTSFYNNSNHAFTDALVDRWKTDGTAITNAMLQFLDDYANSELLAGHDKSVLYDNNRWNTSYPTASESIVRQKAYFPARKTWLNEHIDEITTSSHTGGTIEDATPIGAGVAKGVATFIFGNVKSDLTTQPGETNRLTGTWTVTGAKEIRDNSSTNHRSWAGAVAQGGDVIFSIEQENAYNAADGRGNYASIHVITYNENGSNSTFTPQLRLTNTEDGSNKTYRLGVAQDTPNRQHFTAYGTNLGLKDNHFNKIEVIFPNLDENSVVSLTAIQFDLPFERTISPNSTTYIPTHFYDQGGNGVGYWSYHERNNWEVYWRRVDVDSVNMQGGPTTINTGIDYGTQGGLQYGYPENWHGHSGFGGTPAAVNGGLANDNNLNQPWTAQQATDYYGQWFNYTVHVPSAVYAAVNISTAQRWTYAENGINSNGTRGVVLTPEGHKMVWSRRYAGGAYVLSIDGENVPTNQPAFPSLLKDQSKIYTHNGLGNADCCSKDEFKAVINDPSQWTSTLLADGTPNDTLFTWPHIVASDGNYDMNFCVDKVVNPGSGDQWAMIPLTAGDHTFRIQNVFGNRNSMGTIEIIAGDQVTPVTQVRLRDHTDGTIASLRKGYPETVTYQVLPNTATNMALNISCTDPDVKWTVNEVNNKGIGTIVFSYEPEDAADAPRKMRRNAEGDSATITITTADAFSSAEPIIISVGMVTGVEEVVAAKQVEKVLYYNPLGIVSAEPFPGLNVVVTTYDDGSKATRKVVK